MAFTIFRSRLIRPYDANQRQERLGIAQMVVALMIGAVSIGVSIWSARTVYVVHSVDPGSPPGMSSVDVSLPHDMVAAELRTNQQRAAAKVVSVSPQPPRRTARIHLQHDIAKRSAPPKDQDKPGPTMFDSCNASTLRLRLCTASGELALASIRTYKRRA